MPPGKEQLPIPELPHALVEAFAQTFVHRQDCYPIQIKDGTYVSINEPLTLDLIYQHLRGEITLGAYALNPDSIAYWLCIDADTEDKWQQLKGLSQTLHAQNVPNYTELSRRGGHFWLFTTPLSGKDIRAFGKKLLIQHDISVYDSTGKQRIELYPKQDELITGTGSLVRLPFGIHLKTGKRYFFVIPSGEPLAPTIRQQIALLATPALVPQEFIDTTLSLELANAPLFSTQKIFAKTPQRSGETLSERIKNSISVFDFVSRYVELDTSGKGFCPFHDDHHKSFGIHRERNFWHCYAGCGGGSVIDFWMKWREIHGQDSSFTETIKDLAETLFG